MLVTPPFGVSSNIALWRAYSKPPVELVVADLDQETQRCIGAVRRLVFIQIQIIADKKEASFRTDNEIPFSNRMIWIMSGSV